MDIEASIGLRLDGLRDELSGMAKDAREAQLFEREVVRGRKVLRLPLVSGTVASSAFTFGGDVGSPHASPLPGFIWNVRLLVINGLTASSTAPDLCDIKVNGQRIWQLNGNSFAQTWSMGEMPLFAGEAFQYVSNGTIAATGTISALGVAVEVPAEMQGKIF